MSIVELEDSKGYHLHPGCIRGEGHWCSCHKHDEDLCVVCAVMEHVRRTGWTGDLRRHPIALDRWGES